MILFSKKRNGGEGLMFININIAGQKGSALVDMRASDLFILEKTAKKLGLSIKKSNRKIKMVNSGEALTVGVVRDVELQIGEWKGNEEFEDLDSSVSKGQSNPYCYRFVIEDCCASVSGYEGWEQGVVVNPTS
ncbi:hypothetical protein GOBAR_AA13383 [Gossypium barbadense]|uniref:Aspartic peptidase DDI1-type domain-containing protein n=1 Tax=Gossypium barbadense TaxID=3634 RepID=A0A2P5XVI7_GOSBA|nr:hypothetical protein GOBAR_AA13383 [Gossypium barbadense]